MSILNITPQSCGVLFAVTCVCCALAYITLPNNALQTCWMNSEWARSNIDTNNAVINYTTNQDPNQLDDWARFDTPYYNLGYPLINQYELYTRISVLVHDTVHSVLQSSSTPVYVYLPMQAGHASTGPYVLHALHNTLGEVGIESYMDQVSSGVPGYANQYTHPYSMNWSSIPAGSVIVAAESNGWLDPHLSSINEQHAYSVKWHLGLHGGLTDQLNREQINVCATHWISYETDCPGASILWGPNPPRIFEGAAKWRDEHGSYINKSVHENIVIYDNDMSLDVDQLSKLMIVPNVSFIRFAGFSREETIDLYQPIAIADGGRATSMIESSG